ncbi:sensor histidine kinase [Novispirillum sp. DQ9]|uniref:sensor histidine kinase n=1 Tax=Novispirillum sp. DQ9 TaxID=3398612 RepID=UPI003C7BCAD9
MTLPAAPAATTQPLARARALVFGHWYEWVVPLLAALLLLPLGTRHFLLFHVTAEVFSSVVGVLVFVVAAATYRFSRNDYLLVIGAGYFWVALVDLIHMVAYKGMNILPGDSANPATQYWLVARGLEALALTIAPLFLTRRARPSLVFLAFGAIVIAAELAIVSGVFPTAYVDGVGLTEFKIAAEYTIMAVIALAWVLVWRVRSLLPQGLFPLVSLSFALTIAAEMNFTAYVGVYDLANQVGHVLKIGSFWFLFLATVRVTLVDPFSAMTRDANTLHAVPDPTLVIARDGRVLYANAAAWRDLGSVLDLAPGARPFAGQDTARVAAALTAGTPLAAGSLLLTLGDAHYDISTTPIRGREHGDAAVVVLRDITPRVQAERGKEVALKALERSNAELEQFAYVASHDLQEPMRQVASYVGLLERRYGERLDGDARDYIGFAIEGVHRLRGIVEDLLTFSRAAHGPLRLEPANCRAALDTALDLVARRASEVGADIRAPSSLPRVLANPEQLVEVFRHLIDNALIYRQPGRPPVVSIEVARAADADTWAFTVRDNGIGIAPAYHARVFELFKRLQTREHHAGNGIGLPLVRRIIERHGGTVTLESTPGEGTAVTFTLRAAEAAVLSPPSSVTAS